MSKTAQVDLLYHADPSAACIAMATRIRGSIGGRFIGIDDDPTEEAAWLDLRRFDRMETYLKECQRISKGGIKADIAKAQKLGYTRREFARPNFAIDINEIHRSAPERQGRPMRETYLKSLPTPATWTAIPQNPCDGHWVRAYGIFAVKGGRIIAGKREPFRLRAYITMQRVGSFGIYSMIIGHADHLRDGLMGALHGYIIERALQPDRYREFSGLAGIMYAGYHQGTRGLVHWKRKALFEPALLRLR